MTPADLCRANGWGVGTVLVGEEGVGHPHQHTTAIEITAVGRNRILAVRLAESTLGWPAWHVRWDMSPNWEATWYLDGRDWRPATPAELEAIRAVTQAKGERG